MWWEGAHKLKDLGPAFGTETVVSTRLIKLQKYEAVEEIASKGEESVFTVVGFFLLIGGSYALSQLKFPSGAAAIAQCIKLA